MPSILELTFYAIVNYIPYMLLALYPFKTVFRFSYVKTAFIFFVFSIVIISFFVLSYILGENYHILSTYLITLLSIAVYFLSIKARLGRMLFNLFMIKNIANFIVVVAKCIEGFLFPESIGTLYHWTNTICMILVLIPLAPIIIYIVDKFFSKSVRDLINHTVWRVLCLVPIFFYGIWLYVFYYSSSESSLQLALKPESSVFMFFYLSGQLLIYICIAKLVIHFNKVTLLEEKNHHLSEQYLQYRCIHDHIEEISKIKHDMRHHLITICNYADCEKYDELKIYLHKYVEAFPQQKISFCGNISLNMLVAYYAQKCHDLNILFKVNLKIPDKLIISDSDISVLFGNLLENAFYACNNMSDHDSRYISFTGKVMQNRLIFIINNSFDNDFLIDQSGQIRSTKHDGYGIGTSSVKNIVQSYNGTVDFSANQHVFSVSMIIPLKEEVITEEKSREFVHS